MAEPTSRLPTSSATSSTPTSRPASMPSAAGPASPGQARNRPPVRPIRRRSARASRRSPTATCTSATPSRSASTSAWRATTAAPATCASTTPTRRRKSRSTSTPSSTRCSGWASTGATHLYFASNYFDIDVRLRRIPDRGRPRLCRFAERRGDARQPRHADRSRARTAPTATAAPAENLDLFRRMKAGEFADGAHVLRAKIDMASPNINLRDPAIYRIKHAAAPQHRRHLVHLPDVHLRPPDRGRAGEHHPLDLHAGIRGPAARSTTGCSSKLADGGLLHTPLPQQIEFARLNLTYVVLSKRKLIQLVEEKHVDGWDDPRLPTLVGARRRGYTPEGFRRFAEQIGVSKSDSLDRLSACSRTAMRDAPERNARRAASPCSTRSSSSSTTIRKARKKTASRPTIRRSRSWASARCRSRANCGSSARTSWKRRPRATSASSPATRCGCATATSSNAPAATRTPPGNVTAVHCDYLPDSKSGTPGADTVQGQGQHPLGVGAARLCRRSAALRPPVQGRAARRRRPAISSPTSTRIGQTRHHRPARTRAARTRKPEQRFQFERHGYFVADRVDSRPGAPVFNRAVTLKDSWGKAK